MVAMSILRLPGQGLGDPMLLDKIDQLLACSLGEYVNLPQLVVVGDQSSGKSSVLEGLTRLSFPRDSGLCTRFATQITFRRIKADTERTISAFIVPAHDKDPGHTARLAAWRGINMESLDSESFAETIRENLMTLNDKFHEKLEETQKKNHREKYESTENEAKAPTSNTERTVRYIHDILAAYYEVASKRFVDKICMQATGYCLLTGPYKPFGLFSPQFVANLTEDQLMEIAGENAALGRQRAQLKKGIKDLETGRKIMM